jgi:RNA polymerase sigma-70 factor (ECF subfamily)
MTRPNKKQNTGEASNTATQVMILATQAGEGNKTAFDQLIDLFHGDIYRMVYYRTGNRMDAEDITQDIFLIAFKSLPKLKNVERFRPWLFKIGLNKVRDFYRKKRVLSIFKIYTEKDEIEVPDTTVNDPPEALENLMKQEFWKHIRLLLNKLGQKERDVFLLRFIDQLTINEISHILKISESSVKTHLYRALHKFRKDRNLIPLLKEEVL